jgi:uncharacterized protein (DUF4415 family)
MKRKRSAGSNISAADPDDAPELTDEYFERADVYVGETLVRRGRPRSERPKQAVKLRLSPDILEHFRAGGAGWQTRINDTLLKVVEQEKRRKHA